MPITNYYLLWITIYIIQKQLYQWSHTTTVACNFRELYYIFTSIAWTYHYRYFQFCPKQYQILFPSCYIITLYSMRYSHFCCELHRNRLKSRSMQLKSIICSFKHQKIVLFFCFSTLSQLHSAITFEPLMNDITRT